MCGIYGWQFDQQPNPASMGALAALLSVGNVERGSHAWGYATSTCPERILKGIGALTSSVPASTLARHASIMVHTRFGTQGALNNVDNAHPFTHGHIVGAHNGMIYNAWAIDAEYGRDYEVDSRHIFEHIKCNIPLTDLEGYGSVEYMDASDLGAIFLCKMLDGELSIVTTAHGVIWASDRDHLDQALQIAGIPIVSRVKVKQGRVYRVCKGKIACTARRLDLALRPKRIAYTYNETFSTGVDMKPTAYDARLDELDEWNAECDTEYRRHISDDTPLSTDEKVQIVEDLTKRTAGKRVFNIAPFKISLGDIARINAKQPTTKVTTKEPAGFISRLLGRHA